MVAHLRYTKKSHIYNHSDTKTFQSIIVDGGLIIAEVFPLEVAHFKQDFNIYNHWILVNLSIIWMVFIKRYFEQKRVRIHETYFSKECFKTRHIHTYYCHRVINTSNGIHINASKTKYMIFRGRKAVNPTSPDGQPLTIKIHQNNWTE